MVRNGTIVDIYPHAAADTVVPVAVPVAAPG